MSNSSNDVNDLYDNQLGEMFGDMVGTINNKKTNYH
jgi:hypothetical protein